MSPIVTNLVRLFIAAALTICVKVSRSNFHRIHSSFATLLNLLIIISILIYFHIIIRLNENLCNLKENLQFVFV